MYNSIVSRSLKTMSNIDLVIDAKTTLIYLVIADKEGLKASKLINSCIIPLFFKNQLHLLSLNKCVLTTSYSSIINMYTSLYVTYILLLELIGIGYRYYLEKGRIYFFIGYSHLIKVIIPSRLIIKEDSKKIVLHGADKYVLGNIYHLLKRLKKVDVYKGKGLKRVYDILILKTKKAKLIGK